MSPVDAIKKCKMMTDADYIKLIRQKLTPARVVHTLAVADSAKLLAETYGADPAKAYTAGLLHDIMKDEPGNVQLQTLQESGIILSRVEEKEPKLWHAMAAEVYAERTLGLHDRSILDAIRYHTTARAGFSLLEKVLYLADFISADRTYEGVDRIRQAAEKGLESGILEGAKFTIETLLAEGHPIHPDTVNAYNEWLLQK